MIFCCGLKPTQIINRSYKPAKHASMFYAPRGFVVTYPDLPGCITCGETIESAVANAADAKQAWIAAALEEGIKIQEPDSLEDYSGQFKLRNPRSLHRMLAEHSKREGISMNQYCVYLLSRNDAMLTK